METVDSSEEITQKFTPEVIEELAKTMRASIEVKDRRHLFNFYPMSFVGKELNQWLLANGHAENIHEAIEIGNHFMNNKVFSNLMGDGAFSNEYLLYRFTVDEKEYDLPETLHTWHSVLKSEDIQDKVSKSRTGDDQTMLITPEEVGEYIGDKTDWHIKSPGSHQFHDLLINPHN